MEEDLYQTSQTELTPSEKRVQARLEKVIDKAEERNKYESAHDPDILGALGIVKQFLVSRRRVCYGGTAMNAILPPKRRFYDPEMDLPDYDFFTPDPKADIEELVNKLKKAGYKDVYHKVGVHEGTTKVLVNFVAIADITSISEDVYSVFFKRAFKKEKVHYTDPDILRMMMYLEMSRPRGDVSRWNKVFERLQLINSAFPPTFKRSRVLGRTKKSKGSKVESEIWFSIYEYCITNQRIVFTGQLDSYYKRVVRSSTPKFNINDHSMPIGFISPNLKDDARTLQTLLGGSENCKLYIHGKRGEIVPEHIEVRYNNLPVAILLQETACHAYLNFPLSDGRSIAIASLDTLITIYYSISIFTKRLKMLIPGIDSKIATFVMLDEENRGYANPRIPAFPINCIGYQKGWPTLLREKMIRLKAMKEGDQL